jgi:pimeloyl-ACP methyl ester carboxylesterase
MSTVIAVEQIEVHGRRVAFSQVGSGPVVVLVHGLAGSMRTWDTIVPDLAERFTVVTPDLPGHGKSASPSGDYSLGAYASGLRDLLDVLGHESATIVGHSFGGGVALQFAYQFPERCQRLVLVSSGGLGTEVSLALRAAALPGSELVIPLLAHRRVIAAGTTLGRWAHAVGINPSTTVRHSFRAFSTLSDRDPRHTFIHTVRAVIDHRGQRINANDRLHLADKRPTLIMWGTDDRIIPVEHAHAAHLAMPGSRLELFEGASHFPHVSHPDHFVSALATFIETTHQP